MKISHNKGRIRERDKSNALLLLLVCVICFSLIMMLVSYWEARQYQTGSNGQGDGIQRTELKHVEYNGEEYVQKKNIDTYLFMGIDKEGTVTESEDNFSGGQADLQLLITIDHANQTWQILQLNRDSMVDVTVLDILGNPAGTSFQQLTLAHSYGDGKELSCENTVSTVSNMFNGQEIDGYMAFSMDAVAIVNDMLGGVPVTVTSDFTAVDPSLVEGETITLQGEQALTFVRIRRDVDDQTNISRMARQRQYMDALQKKLKQQDANFAVEAYEAVMDYMVTDMGSGEAANIAGYMKEYTELDLLTIDGESRIENNTNAYYLNEDSKMQVMLQMFYEKSK